MRYRVGEEVTAAQVVTGTDDMLLLTCAIYRHLHRFSTDLRSVARATVVARFLGGRLDSSEHRDHVLGDT